MVDGSCAPGTFVLSDPAQWIANPVVLSDAWRSERYVRCNPIQDPRLNQDRLVMARELARMIELALRLGVEITYNPPGDADLVPIHSASVDEWHFETTGEPAIILNASGS